MQLLGECGAPLLHRLRELGPGLVAGPRQLRLPQQVLDVQRLERIIRGSDPGASALLGQRGGVVAQQGGAQLGRARHLLLPGMPKRLGLAQHMPKLLKLVKQPRLFETPALAARLQSLSLLG